MIKVQESKSIPAFLLFLGENIQIMYEYLLLYSKTEYDGVGKVRVAGGTTGNAVFRQEIIEFSLVEKPVETVNNRMHKSEEGGSIRINEFQKTVKTELFKEKRTFWMTFAGKLASFSTKI